MKQLGERCRDEIMVQETAEQEDRQREKKTKRGSYFLRIRKYRPCGPLVAEGRQGLGLEGSIAIRVLNRNRSSTSSSYRSTRKKKVPTWT